MVSYIGRITEHRSEAWVRRDSEEVGVRELRAPCTVLYQAASGGARRLCIDVDAVNEVCRVGDAAVV
jgi:hypothetical protein